MPPSLIPLPHGDEQAVKPTTWSISLEFLKHNFSRLLVIVMNEMLVQYSLIQSQGYHGCEENGIPIDYGYLLGGSVNFNHIGARLSSKSFLCCKKSLVVASGFASIHCVFSLQVLTVTFCNTQCRVLVSALQLVGSMYPSVMPVLYHLVKIFLVSSQDQPVCPSRLGWQ